MNSHFERNQYMLKGPLKRHGYDWWWHNFTAYHRDTGEERAFFIEYFIINPGLSSDHPILGQLPKHQASGIKPSYALIKCGTWGKQARQIHEFYPIKSFSHAAEPLSIRIGEHMLSDTALKGECHLTEEEAQRHPEYMSDSGHMTWDLVIDKKMSYAVGYGASSLFRTLQVFDMFWHVQGIQTAYSGVVTLDGEVYDVFADRSFGYADKNWGRDFTSPWLWMSSCHLIRESTGEELKETAFDFGGGKPSIYGLPLSRKLLGCLIYEGQLMEYNFSKFWTGSNIQFAFDESDPDTVHWTLVAKNRRSKIVISLFCRKSDMLFMNYEAPSGLKRHKRLWNGGNGYGTLKLYELDKDFEILKDSLMIKHAGCEYGEYD